MSENEGASWCVSSLWCYPVKSMQGEERDELIFNADGVAGDRQYGVFDETSRTVLSAKREGRLFSASATLRDGELTVTLPDGRSYEPGEPLDEALTQWLGRPLRLVASSTFGAATYESQSDFERDESPLKSWDGPPGSFVDDSPLHLLTSLDLAELNEERPELQWDVRRFRPNVFMDPLIADPSPLVIGSRATIGECEVDVHEGCKRCVMTTRAQPGALDRELDILRHVARHHDNTVGVRATVVRAGTVRVGDHVNVLG
ncbi:MAG TPA: MOSC N-terminal beta barrel domain-containing protein [Acidimicrobiales bacterium]